MLINKPILAHINTIELPPELINGMGIPVNGISFVTPATFTNIGNITEAVRPSARDFVKAVLAFLYM